MRYIYGNKYKFAIEYETKDNNECSFGLWVDKKEICSFIRNGKYQQVQCNLSSLAEWFSQNMDDIIREKNFPLPIKANSSIDFYYKSAEFDSDDMDEFDRWFDIRQEWYFRHSWFINRDGSFLADVFFRAVDEKIEIEWDNMNTYEGVVFQYPKGICYVDKKDFYDTLYSFLQSCKKNLA